MQTDPPAMVAPNGAQTVAARRTGTGQAVAGQGAISDGDMEHAGELFERLARAYESKVVGQPRLRTTLVVTLLAEGHILLESVPGLAKTTAAATLACAVNASFVRIQCTPDLLPSDILGTQVYDPHTATFDTRLGPVHANFVLLRCWRRCRSARRPSAG